MAMQKTGWKRDCRKVSNVAVNGEQEEAARLSIEVKDRDSCE
jgi:hypothetical protein